MEINGTRTVQRRAKELKKFRESAKSEVLIVSSVGTTGLNLECANILIILVRCFDTASSLYRDVYHDCRMCSGQSRTPPR